jgi:two-component sensor histidine kinase
MKLNRASIVARQFVAVILLSIVFTLLISIVQMYNQIRQGNRELENVLTLIQESYLPPISAAVFHFDTNQLDLLVEGIHLLPYIKGVEVVEHLPDRDVVLIGFGSGEMYREDFRSFPLFYVFLGSERFIGNMRIFFSLEDLRDTLLSQLRLIIITDIIKVFGISLAIFALVQRMVFRNLSFIAAFVHSLDPQADPRSMREKRLILPRRRHGTAKPDELDEIVGALNAMLERLSKALDEKSILVQELYHRTGNMLQSARAILHIQSEKGEDNEQLMEIVREVDNRIIAISLVYQSLLQSKNLTRIGMRDYIIGLVQSVYSSYDGNDRNIELVLEIEDVAFLIDTAVPCGMILTEFLSNSFRHGFADLHCGTIGICLAKIDDWIFRLTYYDNGSGVPKTFLFRDQNSFGIPSVISLVEGQLSGTIEPIEPPELLNPLDSLCSTDSQRPGFGWCITFSDKTYDQRFGRLV